MTYSPRRAEEILQALRLKRPEDIDLEAIAWLQGAKVHYREMDGCEACIHGRADVGRAIIAVNDAHGNLPRQRFSLAHELGHWEWHRGQHLFCAKEDIGGSRGRERGLSREKGANRFASELLMPEFMLKSALSDFTKFDMRAVRILSNAFAVSKTAMAYRLVDLDFEPSLLQPRRPQLVQEIEECRGAMVSASNTRPPEQRTRYPAQGSPGRHLAVPYGRRHLVRYRGCRSL